LNLVVLVIIDIVLQEYFEGLVLLQPGTREGRTLVVPTIQNTKLRKEEKRKGDL
jgi:hypothetical protein